MKIKLIVVGGLARNGKSTLCYLLQQHAQMDGWQCQRFSFADPLKSIVRIVQSDFVNKNPTALQATSDQWKFNYGQSCFAKDLPARVNAYVESLPPIADKLCIFVDDVRFKNELAELDNWKDDGKQLIKVKVIRPGFDQFDRDMDHPSEKELLDVEYEDYRIEAPDIDTLTLDAAELWKLIRL